MEVLTVEKVTQYGIRANGRNYGISPRLKEAGITPEKFSEGASYQVEVYTGPKGGKSINSFAPSTPPLLPPPALPPTTVTDTKAPGGIPPVSPAQKRAETALPPKSDDKMSKSDWDEKSRLIHLDAIYKSTLESPALAQLVVGKRLEEAMVTKREWFKSSLKDYDDAKNGSL